MVGQMNFDTTSWQVLHTAESIGGQILTYCFDIQKNLSTDSFFLFYVDSAVRNDSTAWKKTHTCYLLAGRSGSSKVTM